jgi:membrane protein YdbS with pleckstrin-like domain
MKFRLNEHPSVWLFLVSLVILATSIVINVLYNWAIYALVAIFIAVAAVLVLGYSMVKDISLFMKQRSQYYEQHQEERDREDDDDEDRD